MSELPARGDAVGGVLPGAVTAWAAIARCLCGMVLALASGCSLLSDFDAHACESDEVCEIPIGSTRYCESGRCVDGCRDNRHCASLDPLAPICSHAEGECVEINSPERECYLSTEYDDASMGSASAESMTILGAFAPTLRSSTWLTLELAASDFEQAGRGASDGSLPPLLLVLCDDAPGAIGGAMDHLFGKLGVRGIVASFDEAARSAALLGARDQALLLSPNGTLDSPGNDLYWHLGGDYRALLPIYPPLLAGLARRIEERSAGTDRSSRVALMAGAGEDARLADLVSEALVVGGQQRAQLEVSDRFRRFTFSDQPSEQTISELIEFAPDLVLVQAGGTFGSPPRQERAEVIGRLEEAAASGTRPPPLYAIGPRQAGDSYLDLLAASSPSFRARAVLVELAMPGQAAEATLRERFSAEYADPRSPVSQKSAPGIYDALYYLAYAAAAGREGRQALSAESLHQGLTRVTDMDGPAVQVGGGSQGLELGRELLRSGRPFNLQGITGSGPLGAARQSRPTIPVISCWSDVVSSTLLGAYDSGSQTLSVSRDSCAGEAVDGVFN